MHGLQACLIKYITGFAFMMLLKGEVGGNALNSHGNYIVDHGKSWNCVFEFLWVPWVTPLNGPIAHLPFKYM